MLCFNFVFFSFLTFIVVIFGGLIISSDSVFRESAELQVGGTFLLRRFTMRCFGALTCEIIPVLNHFGGGGCL